MEGEEGVGDRQDGTQQTSEVHTLVGLKVFENHRNEYQTVLCGSKEQCQGFRAGKQWARAIGAEVRRVSLPMGSQVEEGSVPG